MRLLCAASMARIDLLRVVCRLATRVSKRTEEDGKRLLRIVRYVFHSRAHRQFGFIGNALHESSLHLFTDADFAGDAVSQRSTSGVHLALHGSHSQYPQQGLSAKQDAVAFSTPEAEWYAGCTGYRKVMIPACALWDVLGPSLRTPMFHEDNQAMVMVVLWA